MHVTSCSASRTTFTILFPVALTRVHNPVSEVDGRQAETERFLNPLIFRFFFSSPGVIEHGIRSMVQWGTLWFETSENCNPPIRALGVRREFTRCPVTGDR